MSAKVAAPPDGHGLRRSLLAVAAIATLAVVETTVALVAPLRAPSDGDWAAAAREVRAGFRVGDLIVAAPGWADPLLRVQVGDLMPPEMEGRLDDDRFGRVWEVSERGARAAATRGGRIAAERRFGALTVRLVERAAEVVSYDFVAHWAEARVSRRERRGRDVSCAIAGDRIQCPGISANYVRKQIVEVDNGLRVALLVPAVAEATIVIEFPAVPLGRALVVATGLHDNWSRKAARGVVDARVAIGGALGVMQSLPVTSDDSGWTRTRIDTGAAAGRFASVRFEISSAAPAARFFAFAAEARR
jgi:hypothetical protein